MFYCMEKLAFWIYLGNGVNELKGQMEFTRKCNSVNDWGAGVLPYNFKSICILHREIYYNSTDRHNISVIYTVQ